MTRPRTTLAKCSALFAAFAIPVVVCALVLKEQQFGEIPGFNEWVSTLPSGSMEDRVLVTSSEEVRVSPDHIPGRLHADLTRVAADGELALRWAYDPEGEEGKRTTDVMSLDVPYDSVTAATLAGPLTVVVAGTDSAGQHLRVFDFRVPETSNDGKFVIPEPRIRDYPLWAASSP